MWYRTNAGAIIGGPFNCPQDFPVAYYDEGDPAVVAFLATIPSVLPNLAGFMSACVSQFGISPLNAFIVKYPLFFTLLSMGDYVDWATLVGQAKSSGILTAGQYTWLQGAAVTYHFPVTLP